MRILLTKIFIIYVEFNMLFSQIEFVLFVLLTGVRTVKYIIPILCPVLFIEYSISLLCSERIRGVLHNGILPFLNHIRNPVQYDFNGVELVNMQLIDELILEDYTGSLVGIGEVIGEGVRMREEDRSNLKIKEHWHIVQDHLGKWCIGLVFEVIDHENNIVLVVDVLVNASLFFRFPMIPAKTYLIGVAEEDENAVILAAELHHNICGSSFQVGDIYDLPDLPLIVKTYWICIIQRTWKRICYRRLKLRGSLKTQRQFELSGSYGYLGGGLRGMLSVYSG